MVEGWHSLEHWDYSHRYTITYHWPSLRVDWPSLNISKKAYFVVENENEIIGGAGISPLDNHEGNTCELQKMYFMPDARGKGLGSEMMTKCLEFAKQAGFDQCYLETLPYMDDARKLYRKVGFKSIAEPMGNTGHYSCTVWMLKKL